MAEFKHTFVDFSQGEISDKLLVLSTSPDSKKAASFLDNAYTTKTKGLKKREGTEKSFPTTYPVSSEYQEVRSFPFFVGEGDSFLGTMYIIRFSELSVPEKADINISGADPINDNAYILFFEFYRYDGDVLTFVNNFGIPLDFNYVNTYNNGYDNYPRTLSNEWLDVFGFRFDRHKNFSVFVHESSSVEPFVVFYDGTDFDWFLYKNGLFQTNKTNYPRLGSSVPFTLPFNESNLNPDLAIGVQRVTGSSDEATFFVRAKYYDATASSGAGGYVNWSDYVPTDAEPAFRAHPFDIFKEYLRITIGGNTYVLKYDYTNTGVGTPKLDDLSDTLDADYDDEHVFSLVLDAESPADLWALTSSEVTSSDYQVESFNSTEKFPDNVVFHSQRLIFLRDGKLFNSVVGNAFFQHQWRFPQSTIFGVYFVEAEDLPTNPGTYIYKDVKQPLLVAYTGTQTKADAFDTDPLVKAFVKKTWVSSGENLEYGSFLKVSNIGSTEDSIYAFDSVRVTTGVDRGSGQSISERGDNFTLFVGANNRSIRDYKYDGRTRQYISDDLNQLNPEIVKHLSDKLSEKYNDDDFFIKSISIDEDEDFVNVIVGPGNTFIRFRYSLSDGISSWSRITLGVDEDSDTYVPVHSASFVRGPNSSGATYIVTNRDGEFYLEKISAPYTKKEYNARLAFGSSVAIKDLPVYLDFSDRQVNATAQRDWVLPDFYFDKTVDVLADGFWIKNIVVGSAGELSLDRDVYTIVAGFPYESLKKTLSIEPPQGDDIGESLDQFKHINRVHIRLHNSYAGNIALTGADYFEKIPYDADNMVVGTSFKLFTGFVRISPEVTSDEDVKLSISSSAPYPLEVVAIVLKGEVNDG